MTQKITDPLAAETTFAYDARLNTIQTTDPLARITQTVYDDLDLPSEITDALNQTTKFVNNGNRDMKKLTDARNHVYGRGSAKECASRSHGQTPLRRQTSKTVKDVNGNKTLFFNLGTDQLEKYDITAATASSTIYEPGIDRPLAEVTSSGVATFYHQDWLGNVVLLSSATGSKTESYAYDVWGKVTAKDASNQPVTTPQSRFLFTAREYDPETGFYHYRARAYAASLGRFLQTDPIDFSGGDVNLFRYVANNAISATDPLGKWEVSPGPGPEDIPEAGIDATKIGYGLACVKLAAAFKKCVANQLEDPCNADLSKCDGIKDARDKVCKAAADMGEL